MVPIQLMATALAINPNKRNNYKEQITRMAILQYHKA